MTSTAITAITMMSPASWPASATAIGNAIATVTDATDALCMTRASNEPHHDHREREQREDHEHHAGAGRDAPAALEPAGDREHVAEDGGDAEDVGAAVAVDREAGERRRATPLSEVQAKTRAPAFQPRRREMFDAPGLPEPSAVTSTPAAARHERGARERPEQVGHGHQECHLDAGVHRPSIQLPTGVGPHSAPGSASGPWRNTAPVG